jgi:hypothetical protein
MKACTGKLALVAAISILSSLTSFARQPVKTFIPDSYTAAGYDQLQQTFGQKKVIPAQFREQILIALSYFPELKDIAIDFRIKHNRTPLTTIPVTTSVFKNSRKRKYIITISDSSIDMLSPILLKRFSFNAEIGVLGHELSHVTDFSHHSTWGLIDYGINHISSKWLDHFEYRTDSICIAHGLGYQLLEWSTSVRKAMHVENYDGADNVGEPMTRERYMNPSTIRKQIANNPIYNNVV